MHMFGNQREFVSLMWIDMAGEVTVICIGF